MPFGTIDAICARITVTPSEVCVTYPVGQQICASLPQLGNADASELLQQFFAQLNSMLAPLGPILSIIDALLAVFECVQALPKVITELDPTELINCIPGLAEAIQKLLKLLPQLAIPILVVEILDAILLYLRAQRDLLVAMAARQLAIIAANTRAAQPGNVQLALVMDCINANFDADLLNFNEQLNVLNRLFGLVNAILELIGVDPLPGIAEVVNPADAAKDIDAVIDFLTDVRATIPIPVDP